jgi:hypothetical protein
MAWPSSRAMSMRTFDRTSPRLLPRSMTAAISCFPSRCAAHAQGMAKRIAGGAVARHGFLTETQRKARITRFPPVCLTKVDLR